ncbi:MAG: ABC transporter substrate-binding protein, partial [Patescibacteria group bacterium]
MKRKIPSSSQLRQVFKVLGKGERRVFLVFLLLGAVAFSFLIIGFYFNNTKVVPSLGGKYAEGIVGQPRFINPIYGETNDTDRTLIDLVFSGIMAYDKNGKIAADLAENYQISKDGKIYEFQLKDNIFWHDGKALTSDDVLFTLKVIQNSDYKSPLRVSWADIEAEKISDKSFKFILKVPYNSFLENCTLKILPKHIWEKINPENFSLSSYNLQPVGSGPFQFKGIKQDETGFIKNIDLESNRKYYGKKTFIAELSFYFFKNNEDLVKSANAMEIDGFALTSFENSQAEAENKIRQSAGWRTNGRSFSVYSFLMPRYFAAFFNNQKSSIFSDESVRKALSFGLNKEELINKINSQTKNSVLAVDSPILPDFFGYEKPAAIYGFDVQKAKELLDNAGFKENGSGKREKITTKQPAFQFKSYLKLGSKGDEVVQLQSCLSSLKNNNFALLLKDEPSGTYGKATENAVNEFQIKYLPELKPTGETGVSTRKKLNELCQGPSQQTKAFSFSITTLNQPQLIQMAESLKNYWQALGAVVDINALSITDIKPIIKERNYDVLLYGEALGSLPDLYPFWHSLQKIDPGLNLSYYENKDVDQLLKDARETMDENLKKLKYEEVQNIIISQAPALFLYNPNYIYWVLEKIQG